MTELKFGVVTTITQNVIYAVPMKRSLLFTSASSPTIVQSTDAAMSATATVTLADGAAEIGGAFIQCTSGSIDVLLKPANG